MFEIQGQSTAVAQLQRVIASGRLASTWIFAGPAGVGKHLTAVALAKTCLCDHPQKQSGKPMARTRNSCLPPDFEWTLACGRCDSCRAVDAGSHPDLHLIHRNLIRYHDHAGNSKASTLGIDVIRGEITGNASPEHPVDPKLYRRSQRGRGKWFIIDEADLMEPPAQNALLKALEEPPAQSFLVLVTASPDHLLATIRSRAQLVRFGALPPESLCPRLLERGLTPGQAKLLARLSGGSLGVALRWLDAGHTAMDEDAPAAPSRRESNRSAPRRPPTAKSTEPGQFAVLGWIDRIALALENLALGRGGGTALAGAIQSCAEQYAQAELRRDPLASKVVLTRDGVAVMLGFAAAWLDDRLAAAVAAPIAAPLSPPGQLAPAVVSRCLAICRAAEHQVDMNAHIGLALASAGAGLEQAIRRGS